MTKTHADCAPSAASMWTKCPAAVTLTRGMERKSSPYAREGSAAHEAAAEKLNTGEFPSSVTIEDDVFMVDADMCEALEPYITLANQIGESADYFCVETKVSVSTPYREQVYGTADLIALTRVAKTLDVVDLKYGRGVPVAASENAQTRTYALGAFETFGPLEDIRHVRMTIVQPRLESGDIIKTETVTVAELAAWKEDVFLPAVERIANGDITEVAGEHCRWCPRAHECKSLQAYVGHKAMVAFREAPPAAATLSDEQLAHIYDHSKVILAWVSRVEEEIKDRLDKGRKIPGYHLVPKRAMRQWIDDDAALKHLTEEMKLDMIDVVKVVSPAAVERILKQRKISFDRIMPLYKKESSGTTISAIGGRSGVLPSRDASLIFEKI